jgi:hypothetical protein
MGPIFSNCSIQLRYPRVPFAAAIAEQIYAHNNAIQAFVLSTYDASLGHAFALEQRHSV